MVAPRMSMEFEELLDVFLKANARVRDNLAGLDSAGLNWRPGADTNSVACLVEHIVNTEERNLARALESVSAPQNPGFPTRSYDLAELHGLLERADRMLRDLAGRAATVSLSRVVEHPHRGPSSALVLLIETVGHVKEHVGHLELTRQLYLQRQQPG
ncbi:MAG TPA: DinB family protein [Chloroflexota bacterium]|nr:DinB family protein [Chloroflexota bacterium]